MALGFWSGVNEAIQSEVDAGRERVKTGIQATVDTIQDFTLKDINEAETKADLYGQYAKDLHALGLSTENIKKVILKGPDAIAEIHKNIMDIRKKRVDAGLILEKSALNAIVESTLDFAKYENIPLEDFIKQKYTPAIKKLSTAKNPEVTFLDNLFGWDVEASANKELDKIVFRETIDEDGKPIKITALDLKRLTRTGDDYGYDPDEARGDKVTIDYSPIMEGLVPSDREKILTTLSTKVLSELPQVQTRQSPIRGKSSYKLYEENAIYQYFLAKNEETHTDDGTGSPVSIKELNDYRNAIIKINKNTAAYSSIKQKAAALQNLTNTLLYSQATSANGFPDEPTAIAFLNMFRGVPNIYSAFNADDTLRINGVETSIYELAPYLFDNR